MYKIERDGQALHYYGGGEYGYEARGQLVEMMIREEAESWIESRPDLCAGAVVVGGRGGARPGAGRKPKSPVAASKVIRIPEQYEAAVRALVAHLDDCAKLGKHYDPVTSEPVYVRSLYQKPQHVIFTVAPLKS